MTRKAIQKVYEDHERTVWDYKPDDKPTDLSKEVERLTKDNEFLRQMADSLLKEIADNYASAYTITLARLATSPSMSVRLRTHYWKKLVTQLWGDEHQKESIE